MSKVGIRELKTHTSEIVRRVREDGETIVTCRGEIVGRIVPIQAPSDPEAVARSWEGWQQLIGAIARHRSDDASAEETMREIRREL